MDRNTRQCYPVPNMRTQIFLALFLAPCLAGFGQTAATPPQALPKDPHEILAMAAPYYDFNDPSLKPWHLKATYQLYGDHGKPTEQGTFEYWWASPKVHRSSWTRQGVTHSDWYTADGKYEYIATGDPLNLFEYKLQALLLAPLPGPEEHDPEKARVVDEGVATNGASGPCVTVAPLATLDDASSLPDQGPFPTYCFDQSGKRLLSVYSFERVITEFASVVQTQGKFLARSLTVSEGKHRLLSANVDLVDQIDREDPALNPIPSAVHADLTGTLPVGVTIPEANKDVAIGLLVKKLMPIYPKDAKRARIQGTVVLRGTVATDGRLHNLRVVSAPSAALAASAFWSVSQWEYRPYELQGQPIPVETTIKVNFALGR